MTLPGEHDNFISSIDNYCDRWCERCDFCARCSVYAAESETGFDEFETLINL